MRLMPELWLGIGRNSFLWCLFFVMGGLWAKEGQAQYPQLSPYFFHKPIQNPAFTGATYGTRASLGFRAAYPSISNSFVSYYAGVDQYFSDLRSGFGLHFVNHAAGAGGLQSNELNLQYAYRLPLSQDWAVQVGANLAYGNRSLDGTQLSFPDQFDGNLDFTGQSSDPFAMRAFSTHYGYGGLGALLYTTYFWAGLGIDYLNQPQVGFAEEPGEGSRMPWYYNAQAGLRYPLEQSYRKTDPFEINAIYTHMQWQAQGLFNQLSLGGLLRYDGLMAGLLYRGAPWSRYNEGPLLNDGLLVQAGMYNWGISFVYAYELPLNNLGLTGGGAHEIGLQYRIRNQRSNRIRRKGWELPIPYTL